MQNNGQYDEHIAEQSKHKYCWVKRWIGDKQRRRMPGRLQLLHKSSLLTSLSAAIRLLSQRLSSLCPAHLPESFAYQNQVANPASHLALVSNAIHTNITALRTLPIAAWADTDKSICINLELVISSFLHLPI